MNHQMRGRKHSRPTSQRLSLLRGLAKDLIKYEQITTTLPKAKDLRPFVEKLVTIGRTPGLASFRKLHATLRDADLVQKVMGSLAARYSERPGGYIRIVKSGFRYGDRAPVAVIELIDRDPAAKPRGVKTQEEASA